MVCKDLNVATTPSAPDQRALHLRLGKCLGSAKPRTRLGIRRAGEKGRDGGGGSLSVKHFCTTKQRRVSLVTRSGQTRIRAAERNQKITHQTELGSRTIWDLNPAVSEDVLGWLVT